MPLMFNVISYLKLEGIMKIKENHSFFSVVS